MVRIIMNSKLTFVSLVLGVSMMILFTWFFHHHNSSVTATVRPSYKNHGVPNKASSCWDEDPKVDPYIRNVVITEDHVSGRNHAFLCYK